MGHRQELDPQVILYGSDGAPRIPQLRYPVIWSTEELIPESAEEVILLLRALEQLSLDNPEEHKALEIERQLQTAVWIDDIGRAANERSIIKTYKMLRCKDPDAHDLQLKPWQWGICLRALDHCIESGAERMQSKDAMRLYERISRAICLESGFWPNEDYVKCRACDLRVHHLESENTRSGSYCRGCSPGPNT